MRACSAAARVLAGLDLGKRDLGALDGGGSLVGDAPLLRGSTFAAGMAVRKRGGQTAPVDMDPVTTNADFYKVIFENDRVRVLEYTDRPGDKTTPHEHPDSIMHTLSAFKRRLGADGTEREVELPAGMTGWLPSQRHYGENIGETDTHVIFVELKEHRAAPSPDAIGPAGV